MIKEAVSLVLFSIIVITLLYGIFFEVPLIGIVLTFCFSVGFLVVKLSEPKTSPTSSKKCKVCTACLKEIKRGEESSKLKNRHEWCDKIV
jgi:hypothetical protein